MSYVYVMLTVILTVYGQLIIKWQVLGAGTFPAEWPAKIFFLCQLLIKPWVISAFVAALLASISWMAAMTKLQLSHAYPFTSLSFVLIFILGGVIFNESITALKILGMFLIVMGIVVGSQG